MLSLVFGAVLLGGAMTGAWSEPPEYAQLATSSDALAGRPLAGAELSRQQAEQLLAGGGDPWAAYYSQEAYTDLTQGRYHGVGLSVRRTPDGVTTVAQVTPAGPAEQAGIAVGDQLLRIDGTPPTGCRSPRWWPGCAARPVRRSRWRCADPAARSVNSPCGGPNWRPVT